MLPPPHQNFVIYVDDVNMPTPEEYGAQPPIECLRLIQTMKGFYDRLSQHPYWKHLARSVILLSAAPPGGGRNAVTKRLSNQFHIMCMAPSNDETLTRIFQQILQQFLIQNKFKKDL